MTAKFEDILARVDSGPWTWMIFLLTSVCESRGIQGRALKIIREGIRGIRGARRCMGDNYRGNKEESGCLEVHEGN